MAFLNNISYREILESKDYYIATPIGTSMMPMIRQRLDTVKLIKPKGRLKKYDVILYQRKDGTYVLHRIIGVKKNSYVLCGDNQFTKEHDVTDDMIIALHNNGGVMGMNYCAAFLSDDEEDGRNTIKWVVEHIKYIKKLVGVDVIALGSDFDGIDSNIELKDASTMNLLINELLKEGFTNEEINKITHENILRVIKENF